MAVDELIDSHVSSNQCKKAVKTLVEHAAKFAKAKEEKELLPGKEENIWLVLSVKKTTPEKKLKPFKIPLAHPIVDPRTTPVCLITKDPQREYKDLLASSNVKFINRVVGIEKLKGKFKPFEARRMLLRENGLFLADERVVPLLPKLLGKIFFEAKKQPLPVNLTKDVKAELERAVSSTYMHQNQGTCTSIKIGTISQSPAQVLDNLKTALPAIVKRIEGGWENIQSFHIKTNSSASLPIWSCALGEGDEARWKAAAAAEAEAPAEGWTGFGGEEKGSESESEADETEKPKKGKKRVADEAAETPSKKAKKTDGKEKAKKSKIEAAQSKTAISDDKTVLKKKADSSATAKVKKSNDSSAVTAKSKSADAASPATSSKADSSVGKLDKHTKSKKGKAPPPPPEDSADTDEDANVPARSPKVVKFDKSAKQAPPEKKSGLTAEELKRKRASGGVEKKKEKVTKGRSGGSIKENLVGKKSKSRI